MTLGGGSTRINATAFYYDYKDYQGFLFTGVGGVVVNNDADNNGIELEIQSSPADGLDVRHAVAMPLKRRSKGAVLFGIDGDE